MQNANRWWYCFLGLLFPAAVAVAQGVTPSEIPAIVVPEPADAPSHTLVTASSLSTPVQPVPLPAYPEPLPAYPEPLPAPPSIADESSEATPPEQIPRYYGYDPYCGCAGCKLARFKACMQRTHWGYADLFEERPLDYCVSAHANAQITNGMASGMVLYRYDFYDDTIPMGYQLNPHGDRRLKRLAHRLQCNIRPLIIEPTQGRPRMDAARRGHVLKVLEAELGFAVPEEWVVVSKPEAAGLSGEEALEIHQNMLEQTKSGGGSGSQTQTQAIMLAPTSNSEGTYRE